MLKTTALFRPVLLSFLLTASTFFGWPAQLMAQGDSGEDLFWQNFGQPGHFVMMRHALAPGTGDPENFDVLDCDTQRLLNASGRQQAADTGVLLQKHGVDSAIVYSSAWCRCLETAGLLGLGAVQNLPALNSFYQNFERSTEQTTALRKWLQQNLSGLKVPLILVTHQVNISALTGTYAGSGEMVLAKIDTQGKVEVVAKAMVTAN